MCGIGCQHGHSTPHELFKKFKPDVSVLPVFGCNTWMLQTEKDRIGGKMGMRSAPMIFIGYSTRSKGYRLLDPSSGKVHESRNVLFDETSFDRSTEYHQIQYEKFVEPTLGALLGEESARKDEDRPNVQVPTGANQMPVGGVSDGEESKPSESQPRRSARFEKEEESDDESVVASVDEEDDGSGYAPLKYFASHAQDSLGGILEEMETTGEVVFDLEAATAPEWCNVIQIPHGLKAAMKTKEWPKWYEAMKTQHSTLNQKGTYKMILRKQMIKGARVLPNIWVYSIKTNDDGSTTFKARLCIGGHLQKKGIDYGETFASVVKFASVRLVLAMATRRGWHVHKVDFVAAFLNSLLQEKVYMQQIPGFEDGTERVLELIKALYGLKQSPREWQKKLREILAALGFRALQSDSSLYTDGTLIIPVYVDDLLVTGPEEAQIISVIKKFQVNYDVKDFGRMKTILGMEWERDLESSTSTLTQKRYLHSVLEKFNMLDCRPHSTPAVAQDGEDNTPLMKETGPYLEAVGSLIYLSTARYCVRCQHGGEEDEGAHGERLGCSETDLPLFEGDCGERNRVHKQRRRKVHTLRRRRLCRTGRPAEVKDRIYHLLW